MAFNFENEVFKAFALHSSVVVLKMFGVTCLTVYNRSKNKVYANSEDVRFFGNERTKLNMNDEGVQRCQRNHLNDLENMVPFFMIGLLYVASGPALSTALWHFRVFSASRVLFMLAYQIPLPQPSRTLCFGAGFISTVSMAVQVVRATM